MTALVAFAVWVSWLFVCVYASLVIGLIYLTFSCALIRWAKRRRGH